MSNTQDNSFINSQVFYDVVNRHPSEINDLIFYIKLEGYFKIHYCGASTDIFLDGYFPIETLNRIEQKVPAEWQLTARLNGESGYVGLTEHVYSELDLSPNKQSDELILDEYTCVGEELYEDLWLLKEDLIRFCERRGIPNPESKIEASILNYQSNYQSPSLSISYGSNTIHLSHQPSADLLLAIETHNHFWSQVIPGDDHTIPLQPDITKWLRDEKGCHSQERAKRIAMIVMGKRQNPGGRPKKQ